MAVIKWGRLALLGMLFSVTASSAQTVIVGFGAATCGQFASEYRSAPARVESLYFTWAQGYLSGRSFEAHSVIVEGKERLAPDLRALSIEQQKRHLREYCDAHPLATYSDAANDLVIALVAAESKVK